MTGHRYEISLDFQPDVQPDIAQSPSPLSPTDLGGEGVACVMSPGGVEQPDEAPLYDHHDNGEDAADGCLDSMCVSGHCETPLAVNVYMRDDERAAATYRVDSLSASVSALAQEMLSTSGDVHAFYREVAPMVFT